MVLVVKYVKKDGTKVYGSSKDRSPIPSTPVRPTLVKNKYKTKVVGGRTIKATRLDSFYEPLSVIRTPEQQATASRFHTQAKLAGQGIGVSSQQAKQLHLSSLKQDIAKTKQSTIAHTQLGPSGMSVGTSQRTLDQAKALGIGVADISKTGSFGEYGATTQYKTPVSRTLPQQEESLSDMGKDWFKTTTSGSRVITTSDEKPIIDWKQGEEPKESAWEQFKSDPLGGLKMVVTPGNWIDKKIDFSEVEKKQSIALKEKTIQDYKKQKYIDDIYEKQKAVDYGEIGELGLGQLSANVQMMGGGDTSYIQQRLFGSDTISAIKTPITPGIELPVRSAIKTPTKQKIDTTFVSMTDKKVIKVPTEADTVIAPFRDKPSVMTDVASNVINRMTGMSIGTAQEKVEFGQSGISPEKLFGLDSRSALIRKVQEKPTHTEFNKYLDNLSKTEPAKWNYKELKARGVKGSYNRQTGMIEYASLDKRVLRHEQIHKLIGRGEINVPDMYNELGQKEIKEKEIKYISKGRRIEHIENNIKSLQNRKKITSNEQAQIKNYKQILIKEKDDYKKIVNQELFVDNLISNYDKYKHTVNLKEQQKPKVKIKQKPEVKIKQKPEVKIKEKISEGPISEGKYNRVMKNFIEQKISEKPIQSKWLKPWGAGQARGDTLIINKLYEKIPRAARDIKLHETAHTIFKDTRGYVNIPDNINAKNKKEVKSYISKEKNIPENQIVLGKTLKSNIKGDQGIASYSVVIPEYKGFKPISAITKGRLQVEYRGDKKQIDEYYARTLTQYYKNPSKFKQKYPDITKDIEKRLDTYGYIKEPTIKIDKPKSRMMDGILDTVIGKKESVIGKKESVIGKKESTIKIDKSKSGTMNRILDSVIGKKESRIELGSGMSTFEQVTGDPTEIQSVIKTRIDAPKTEVTYVDMTGKGIMTLPAGSDTIITDFKSIPSLPVELTSDVILKMDSLKSKLIEKIRPQKPKDVKPAKTIKYPKRLEVIPQEIVQAKQLLYPTQGVDILNKYVFDKKSTTITKPEMIVKDNIERLILTPSDKSKLTKGIKEQKIPLMMGTDISGKKLKDISKDVQDAKPLFGKDITPGFTQDGPAFRQIKKEVKQKIIDTKLSDASPVFRKVEQGVDKFKNYFSTTILGSKQYKKVPVVGAVSGVMGWGGQKLQEGLITGPQSQFKESKIDMLAAQKLSNIDSAKVLQQKESIAKGYADIRAKKIALEKEGRILTAEQLPVIDEFVEKKLNPYNKKFENYNEKYSEYVVQQTDNKGNVIRTTVDFDKMPKSVKTDAQKQMVALNTEWKKIEPQFNKMRALDEEGAKWGKEWKDVEQKEKDWKKENAAYTMKFTDLSEGKDIDQASTARAYEMAETLGYEKAFGADKRKLSPRDKKVMEYQDSLSAAQLGLYKLQGETKVGIKQDTGKVDDVVTINLWKRGAGGQPLVYETKLKSLEYVKQPVTLSKKAAEKRIFEETGGTVVSWENGKPVTKYTSPTRVGQYLDKNIPWFGKKMEQDIIYERLKHQLYSEDLTRKMDSSLSGLKSTTANLINKMGGSGAEFITDPVKLPIAIGGIAVAPTMTARTVGMNVGRPVIILGGKIAGVIADVEGLTREEKRLLKQGDNLIGSFQYAETKAHDYLMSEKTKKPVRGTLKDFAYNIPGAQATNIVPQKVIEKSYMDYFLGQGMTRGQANIATKGALKHRKYMGKTEASAALINEMYSEALAGREMSKLISSKKVGQKLLTPWEAGKIIASYGAGEAYAGAESMRMTRTGDAAAYKTTRDEQGNIRRVYEPEKYDIELLKAVAIGKLTSGAMGGMQRYGIVLAGKKPKIGKGVFQASLAASYALDFPYEAFGDLSVDLLGRGARGVGLKRSRGVLGVITGTPTTAYTQETSDVPFSKYLGPPEGSTKFGKMFKGKKGQISAGFGGKGSGSSLTGAYTGLGSLTGGTEVGQAPALIKGPGVSGMSPVPAEEKGKSKKKAQAKLPSRTKMPFISGSKSGVLSSTGIGTDSPTSIGIPTSIGVPTSVSTSTGISSSTSTSITVPTSTTTNIMTGTGTGVSSAVPAPFGGMFMPGALGRGRGRLGAGKRVGGWVVTNPVKYLAGSYFAKQQSKIKKMRTKFKTSKKPSASVMATPDKLKKFL